MGEKRRILFVDDNEAISVLHRVLENRGWQINSDYGNGLDVLQALKGEILYDFAVVDLSLPGVDGARVCEALKEKYPDKPIVAISGHSFHGERKTWNAFMQKPFNPTHLEELLERLEKMRL